MERFTELFDRALHVRVLTLSTEEGLSHVAPSLVGHMTLVAGEVGWLDVANG